MALIRAWSPSKSSNLSKRITEGQLSMIICAARSAIASVEQYSGTARLIKKSGRDLCEQPEDPLALVNAIKLLKEDKRLCQEMGQKGRRYVERNFDKKIIYFYY
jgi:glycosyltransferase involved in cell wall biosynthesis